MRAWRHGFRIHWSHTDEDERLHRMFEKWPQIAAFLNRARVTLLRSRGDKVTHPQNLPRKLTGFSADLPSLDIIIEHNA